MDKAFPSIIYLPSLKNSVDAASRAREICSPGLYPDSAIDIIISSKTSLLDEKFGAKPPSSPTFVANPLSLSLFLSV